MNRRVVLLRHARPVVEPGRPRGEWPLGDDGVRAATDLGMRIGASIADHVVLSSAERKAIETARFVCGGREPTVLHGFGEIERPWYDDAAAHNTDAERLLAGVELPGWERVADAVARFDAAIATVVGPAVIATHGTVMAAWVKSKIPDLDAPSWWRDLTMPDAWEIDPEHRTATRLA